MEDELCHRCLSAAAVCLTVGLRIRSIVGSRGECAALTRQRRGDGETERETFFVYKIVLEGKTMYITRQHASSY